MDHNFKIEFILFKLPMTKEQNIKMEKIINKDINDIVQNALIPDYKLLERAEFCSISTLDENKQLRIEEIFRKNITNSIVFAQYGKELFSLNELILIVKRISSEFEEYLGYEFDTKIFLEDIHLDSE